MELHLQSNSYAWSLFLVRVTSKFDILYWDIQAWKLSKDLDFMQSLMTATSALKGNSNISSCQEGHPTVKKF
jgi:hypothetical protein